MTCCQLTAIWTFTHDVAASEHGYSSLPRLRNHHLTATKMPSLCWHTQSPHSPRNCEKSVARDRYLGMLSVCRSAPDSNTSHASYGLIDGICSQKISDEAVETGPFYWRVPVHSFSPSWPKLHLPASWWTLHRRLRYREGLIWVRFCYGLWRHFSWCKITADCDSKQFNCSKVQGWSSPPHCSPPLVQQQRQLILQQDNAWSHEVRVYLNFLAHHNIILLGWPPYISVFSLKVS